MLQCRPIKLTSPLCHERSVAGPNLDFPADAGYMIHKSVSPHADASRPTPTDVWTVDWLLHVVWQHKTRFVTLYVGYSTVGYFGSGSLVSRDYTMLGSVTSADK